MEKVTDASTRTKRLKTIFVMLLLVGGVLPASLMMAWPSAEADVTTDDYGNMVIDGVVFIIDQTTVDPITGATGMYSADGNITIRNGGELRLINATLNFLSDAGPDMLYFTADDNNYGIYVESGGILNITNSRIIAANDTQLPLQNYNISLSGASFYAVNSNVHHLTNLSVKDSSTLVTEDSRFHFYNVPRGVPFSGIASNDTIRIVDSSAFLNGTVFIGEEKPKDILDSLDRSLVDHLYLFPGAPTFRAIGSNVVMADSSIGLEDSTLGTTSSIYRAGTNVTCKPDEKGVMDGTGSSITSLASDPEPFGPAAMDSYIVPNGTIMHVMFQNNSGFPTNDVIVKFAYHLREKNSSLISYIEWSVDGVSYFPLYRPTFASSGNAYLIVEQAIPLPLTEEQVSSFSIRFINDHPGSMYLAYMYLDVYLSQGVEWDGWEHIYFDSCTATLINTYIDADTYGDARHLPIMFTGASTARMLNLRIRNREITEPIREKTLLHFEDADSRAYIYRWADFRVIDEIGQHVPNATISFEYNGTLSPTNWNLWNQSNDMSLPHNRFIEEYLLRVYGVDHTTYLTTPDNGHGAMIPLLSDVCREIYQPNSYFVGNYRFDVSYQNETESWSNDTVGASLPYFPLLQAADNTMTITSQVPTTLPSPDLYTDSSNITFDPIYPTHGDDVTITARIHNLGDAAAPAGVMVSIINKTVSGGNFYLANLTVESAIPIDGWAEVSTTVTAIDWPSGSHPITAKVDPLFLIHEVNETNNDATKLLYLNASRDLYPIPGTISATPTTQFLGETVTLQVDIANDGIQNITTPFTVAFYNDTDNKLLGTTVVNNMSAMSSINVNITWLTDTLGPHRVRVAVDIHNNVAEYDETNNILVDAVDTFTVNPKPDLMVSSIQFSNPYSSVGDTITITATIFNIGGGDAGGFSVRAWDDRNGDGVWSATENIGQDFVASLASAASVNVDFVWAVAGPRGSHNIYVQVNWDVTVNEFSYTNNILSAPLFVVNRDLDIIVNQTLPFASPESLTISDVWPEMEHHGFVLVEDSGLLVIENSGFRVVQDYAYQYFFAVRENGTLHITDSSIYSNLGMRILLFDNATLILEGSATGSNIDIEYVGHSSAWFAATGSRGTIDVYGSALQGRLDVRAGTSIDLSMANTTITRDLTLFGGDSIAELTSVTRAGVLPTITPSENAYVHVYWWLSVAVKDANLELIESADVAVYSNVPPMVPAEFLQTGSDGTALFRLLARNISATGVVYTENYMANATYLGHDSENAHTVLNANKNIQLVVGAKPDLTIEIDVDSTTVNTGQVATFTIWANNTGESGAIEAQIVVRAGAVNMYTITIDLPAGDSFMDTFTWTFTSVGVYTVNATIDPINMYQELDDNNNWDEVIVTVETGMPDPTVTSIAPMDVTVYNTEVVVFTVRIDNMGTADLTENFPLRILINNVTVVTTTFTTDIIVGGFTEVNVQWTATPAGVHWVTIEIAPTFDLDHTNNNLSTTITVLPRPNLVPTSIYLDDTVAMVGTSYTVTADISNTGQQAAGAFSVRFLVDGVELGTSVVGGGVPSLGMISVSCPVLWTPVSGGSYILSVEVDIFNQIIETSKADNQLSTTITAYRPNDDIVVRAGETLVIENNPNFEHNGMILVEDDGILIIRNSLLRIRQTSPATRNVIVRNQGTMILEMASSLTTVGGTVNMRLYDDANLIVQSGSTIDGGMELNFEEGSDATLQVHASTMRNTFAFNPMASYQITAVNSSFLSGSAPRRMIMGGTGHSDFTAGSVGEIEIAPGSTATATRYFWLTVNVLDANGYGIGGASASVYRGAFMVHTATATTGPLGTALFQLRSKEYFAGGSQFVGNYFVNATFTFGVQTFFSTGAWSTLEGNSAETVHVPDAMPNLDPIVTMGLEEIARGHSTWINVSGITNVGVVTAYDVILRIEDHDYSPGPTSPKTIRYWDYSLGDIAPGQVTYINTTWTATYSLGTHTIWARLDPEGNILEPNKNNNDAFTTINVTSYPDLNVTNVQVFGNLGTGQVTRGQQATVQATIFNYGDLPSGPFNVSFYYIYEGAPVLIGNRTISNLVELTGNTTSQLTWSVPPGFSLGTHTIRVVVDATGNLTELRYDNNQRDASVTVRSMADLYIPEIILTGTRMEDGLDTAYAGEMISILVDVGNQGDTGASSALVELYRGSPSDGLLVGSSIISIPAKESRTAAFAWQASLPPGNVSREYSFTVHVNGGTMGTHVIPEENYSNNAATSPTLVVWDNRPDFLITDVVFFRSDWTEVNETNRLVETRQGYANVTVMNRGSTTNTTTVEAWIEGGDKPVGENDTVSPPARGAIVITVPINLPVSGTVNITFVVDPENNTYEVVETNNELTLEIEVDPAPFRMEINTLAQSVPMSQATILITGTISSAQGVEELYVLLYRGPTIVSNTTATITGFDYRALVPTPSDPGHYEVRAFAIYHGELYDTELHYRPVTVSSVDDDTGIPMWMILLIIVMIVVPLVALSLYLRKYGLGTLVECGECNALIPIGSSKCPKCSVEFEPDTVKCSVCESWISKSSTKCPECGAEFVAVEVTTEEYREKMEEQYSKFTDPFKVKAAEELNVQPEDLTPEMFEEWWRVRPEYISFADWLSMEEEKRAAIKPVLCPECGSLNPSGSKICYKCGIVLGEGDESNVELPDGWSEEKASSAESAPTPEPAPDSTPEKKPVEQKRVVVQRPGEQKTVARKVVAPPEAQQVKRVVVQRPTEQQPAAKHPDAPTDAAGKPVVVRRVVKPDEKPEDEKKE